jgi:hypothetical protein
MVACESPVIFRTRSAETPYFLKPLRTALEYAAFIDASIILSFGARCRFPELNASLFDLSATSIQSVHFDVGRYLLTAMGNITAKTRGQLSDAAVEVLFQNALVEPLVRGVQSLLESEQSLPIKFSHVGMLSSRNSRHKSANALERLLLPQWQTLTRNCHHDSQSAPVQFALSPLKFNYSSKLYLGEQSRIPGHSLCYTPLALGVRPHFVGCSFDEDGTTTDH